MIDRSAPLSPASECTLLKTLLVPLAFALVGSLTTASIVQAATERRVVVEDVKAKDVKLIQMMGEEGYLLLLKGKSDGWQTAHTLFIWDRDLNPLGQETFQLPAEVTLNRGVFDGKQLYLTTTDVGEQEIQVHAFTTAAEPVGVHTIEADLKPAYRQYLYGSSSAAPGSGVYLVMLDLYKRKFACQRAFIGRDLTVQWEQLVFHPKAFTRCSKLEEAGTGLAVQMTSRVPVMGGTLEKDLNFIDSTTGNTVASHRLNTDEYVLSPTTIFRSDEGLFLAGESSDGKRAPIGLPDGFFVTRFTPDGEVVYSVRANWDAEARQKYTGGDDAAYDAMISHRAGILVHEVLSFGANDLVVAELVRRKAGGNGTTVTGELQTTQYTFGDYLLIRIDRDSGSLVDLQLVPKADRKVDLPPAFADQLGFARVAREQSWSGYLFADPVGEDGAYRVVSWSNEESGRSLDTLTFSADGTVATGSIPLEAMRRRDRTAMFRSTPGHVVVVQYDAKERRLTLEQLPIE